MDVQTGLVCVVLVVISGATLFFISMFGMQEKTYEEAIAEQRKMPNDALLLGRPNKVKSKEKKLKRQGKKAKEKPNSNKSGNNKESGKSKASKKSISQSSNKENEYVHVNFVTPEAEVLNKVNSIQSGDKNKKKKDKIKPILLNKEEPSSILKEKQGQKGVTVNHFTEIIPKDDLQLKLATSKANHNLNNSKLAKSNENFVKKENTKDKSFTKAVTKDSNIIGNEKNKKNEVKSVNKPNKENKENKNNKNEKIKNVQQEQLKQQEQKQQQSKQQEKKQQQSKQQERKQKQSKPQEQKQQQQSKQQEQKQQQQSKQQEQKQQQLKQQEQKQQQLSKQQEQKQQQSKQQEQQQQAKQLEQKQQQSKQEQKQQQSKQEQKQQQSKQEQKQQQSKQEQKQQQSKQEQKQQQSKQEQKQQKQVKVEVNGNLSSSSGELSPIQQNQQQKVQNCQQPKTQNQQLKVQNQQLNNVEQKIKKQRKNGFSSFNRMDDRDIISVPVLEILIRRAELTRNEVQVLTNILLNKHSGEVSDHFEWIEGRQDPVVKLKKQLAEKEKALAEEQEAAQAFQNRLKELRSEYNAERARLTQACRQYDESILAKQGEIQNLHATNRHMLDSHVAEKQALTQKIQKLQAQVNDDNMVIRKLQEDHNQTQNALQQELVNQRQQMEMHIGRLSEQLQEAQKNLEVQIHAKMQEAEQIRASFNAELQKNIRYEDELRELREQHVQSQNKIKNLESRASQLKESNNHSQELARQIEELQRTNKDLEKRLNNSLQSEDGLKFEKNKLQNEIHCYTKKVLELQNNCDLLHKDREELKVLIAAKIGLEKDLSRMKEENQSLISQVSSFTKIEREAQQLREENENLAAQVTAFMERPAADGRENGDSPFNEEKKQNINVEFINHENETKEKDVLIEKLADDLKEKEILVEKLNSELNGCQSEISRLSSEVAKFKTEVPKLKKDLEEQRSKSNDCLEQVQQASKSLLERVFPNINIDEKVYEDWLHKFESNAKDYLEEIKSASEKSSPNTSQPNPSYVEELENKNSKLQNLVVYYKNIIEDTEGMLNKLQNHVEKEEIRWRQQFEAMEPQLQTLKESQAVLESANAELKSKVKELEEKLEEKEDGDLDSVRKESEELRTLVETESERSKKLSEENEELNSKLAAGEEEIKELNMELAKLRNTLLNSQTIHRDAPINSSADFVASEGGGYERE